MFPKEQITVKKHCFILKGIPHLITNFHSALKLNVTGKIITRKLLLTVEFSSFFHPSISNAQTCQACNCFVINNSLTPSSFIHNCFWWFDPNHKPQC